MANFVSKFMSTDHAYLDKLWLDFLMTADSIPLPMSSENKRQVLKLLLTFKRQLMLHIEIEDKFLFPRLNKNLSVHNNSGLTIIASQEHHKIIKLLHLVEQNIRLNNIAQAVILAGNLGHALTKHHNKERNIQYPLSDSFITESEWYGILYKIYGTANYDHGNN